MEESELVPAQMEPLVKLNRDLKTAARLLGKREVIYLVNQYYVIQKNRMRREKNTLDNHERRWADKVQQHKGIVTHDRAVKNRFK